MKKNKTLSFFKTTLLVLMASTFSISNSYGVNKLIKKESFDSTSFNLTHSVPQATWNHDVKNAHIEVKFAIDKKDIAKPKYSFLFFRFCEKPDDMWFLGSDGWKQYKKGEAPNPHNKDISARPPGVIPEVPFISMNTGKPIDISSMVDFPSNKNPKCGELLAGYGLGTTSQEAYDEMFSQKRFNVVFDTQVGTNHRIYLLEIKTVSTRDFPPVINVGICSYVNCL